MKELLETLKPLSLSEDDLNLSKFKSLVTSISNFFMFNCIDFSKRIELKDYVIPSLDYINNHLQMVDSSIDILEKIDKFYDIVSHINDAIIEKNCNVICADLRYDREQFDLIYFTYLWTSLTTTMLVKLAYNYGWVKNNITTSFQCGCDCSVCKCCSTCPFCNCNTNNKGDYEYRPIQESYYTKVNGDTSFLERW